MIELSGVSKSFSGQRVLENLSLQIQEGEKLCIVGPSGTGKSVLLKLITGLILPDAGKIMIEGKDASAFREEDWQELRPHFGFVFQGGALFDSLTTEENVGIRLRETGRHKPAEIRDKVIQALEKVGLGRDVLPKLPGALSGGMRKRVAIARAIVDAPRYILYDEPTTGLDPVNSGLIDKLIHDLSLTAGLTSVVVTHDMHTVRSLATRVVFLIEGRIQFEGSPAAFFASELPSVVAFLSR